MRLWHEALIPYLPRQQLLGLHREVCALRGLGWGKKHATVNYVFEHPYGWLVAYHAQVMEEMIHRGYQPDEKWWDARYRGKRCKPKVYLPVIEPIEKIFDGEVYPEHDAAYLQECLDNLAGKGIHIDMGAKK